MRSWHPIPPFCLDKARLLGEHREIHCIFTVLTQNKTGYSRHPETLRWRNHLPALAERHRLIVKEMVRRGWAGHKSSMDVNGAIEWPGLIEPLEDMRASLASKQRGMK